MEHDGEMKVMWAYQHIFRYVYKLPLNTFWLPSLDFKSNNNNNKKNWVNKKILIFQLCFMLVNI